MRTISPHLLESGFSFETLRQSPNIRGAFNKFPDLFIQAFKIAIDS